MSKSRVPEGGSFRLQMRSTARDRWMIVGPFPAPLAAKRLAEDLMATGLLRSVKVEHRVRGGWRTAWSWLASACLGLMLCTGCATTGKPWHDDFQSCVTIAMAILLPGVAESMRENCLNERGWLRVGENNYRRPAPGEPTVAEQIAMACKTQQQYDGRVFHQQRWITCPGGTR